MSQVDAIYRHGVFEPLQPVNLKEEQRVRLRIEPTEKESWEVWLERVKRRHEEFVKQHGFLPDSAPGIAEDRLR